MAPLADTDVVIVEAVRSPLGRRNGGLSTVHPADLLGHVQTGAIERSGIDPARGRPARRRVREPGRRADVQHRPHRLAGGRHAARGCRDHRRRAVRLVAAGDQPGGVADQGGGGRRRAQLRGGEHEPGTARRGRARRLRPTHSEVATSRGTRSRRSSKAPSASPTSGASPARTATGSASSRRPGRSGRGPRAASNVRCVPSTRRTSTRTASPPARRTRSPGTRACARPRSRRWPSSSPSGARTVCTPRARRRRSPTVPRRCCS